MSGTEELSSLPVPRKHRPVMIKHHISVLFFIAKTSLDRISDSSSKINSRSQDETMAPIIKEVTTEAELSAVVDCFWEANHRPYQPFMNVLFPVTEATDEGYAKAVAESKSRLWSIHQGDPSSHWIYVTDDEDGKGEVYSGAHWNFHEVSPYKDEAPNLVAIWYPEGEGRNFASHILNQIYSRRPRLWRPHAQLDYMFTYTHQRRKGYASMSMKWGMDIAEKMGVEVAVEASELGLPLYKKFGLRSVEKIAIDTYVDNPSNSWIRLNSDFHELAIWWMWKPHGGVYEDGKMRLPWVATRGS